MNTKSELKVRIKSIRCCSVSGEEAVLSAPHSALNRQNVKRGKTRRGRIQVPTPIIFFDGKGSPLAALPSKNKRHVRSGRALAKEQNQHYLAVNVNLSTYTAYGVLLTLLSIW